MLVTTRRAPPVEADLADVAEQAEPVVLDDELRADTLPGPPSAPAEAE